MSVLVDFVAPAEEFVLSETLTTVSEMRIEIERVVVGTPTVTPYFWASNGDFTRFEEALRSDETVQEVRKLKEDENQSRENQTEDRFYRVTWKMEVPNLITAISEAEATILEAVSDGHSTWEIKALFPDDIALSEFHDDCIENEFDIRPKRIYRPENPEGNAAYDLTEEQQEALEAAFDLGYFDVPREHTLTEIAEQIDISRNALSTRLRRGHRNLLRSTLIHDE